VNASQQIDVAVPMLARHQDGLVDCCSCGRPLSCTVAEACHRARDHYQDKLALPDARGAELPVLAAAQEPHRVLRWRRLLRGGL
jgi:hypothetical protein